MDKHTTLRTRIATPETAIEIAKEDAKAREWDEIVEKMSKATTEHLAEVPLPNHCRNGGLQDNRGGYENR